MFFENISHSLSPGSLRGVRNLKIRPFFKLKALLLWQGSLWGVRILEKRTSGLPREVLEGKPAAGGQNHEHKCCFSMIWEGNPAAGGQNHAKTLSLSMIWEGETGRQWPKPLRTWGFCYVLRWCTGLHAFRWHSSAFVGRAPLPPALYQNRQNPYRDTSVWGNTTRHNRHLLRWLYDTYRQL